ncbi:antitoxin PrlF [Oxalobacteraceae bacterium GrIS 2.11]
MLTKITAKGQLTIPKKIRDALGLTPGAKVDFAVNQDGDVVLQRAKVTTKRKKDRFESVRGNADIKWRTDDLTALLRGES